MSEAISPQEAQLLFAPVEAILMVVDQPVTSEELGRVLNLPPEDMESVLHMLAAEYSGAQGGRDHGFELRRFGGGWRIYSSARWESLVSQFIVGTGQSRLSQAALETLAVIAYRQPISRARISQIRGVNVVRTLLARELVEEVGQSSSGARLYATTAVFLERMGMNSLDELAPLAPYLPASDELDELEETL